MKEIIIFLGAPASGKGTQSKMLTEQINFTHLSTGSLLREEVDSGSSLGKKIEGLIDYGNLVPDDLMFEVLKKKLENIDTKGFIVDGFPRTLKQAKMFDEYLEKNPQFKLKIIYVISVDKKQIMDRIGHRIACKECGSIYNTSTNKTKISGICDNCQSTDFEGRNDDKSIAAIEKRIDIFEANIGDIMSFYEKKGLIFLIDGLKDINIINQEIIKALN